MLSIIGLRAGRLRLCIALISAFGSILIGQSPPSFPALMGQTRYAKHKPPRLQRKDRSLLKHLSRAYSKQINLLRGDPLNHIPHQMHLIWIGPKAFPQESVDNVQAFRDVHPDWTMNFWTDSEDRPLPILGMIRRLVTEEYFQPVIDLYSVGGVGKIYAWTPLVESAG